MLINHPLASKLLSAISSDILEKLYPAPTLRLSPKRLYTPSNAPWLKSPVVWMGYTLVDTKDKEICYTKEK